MRAFAEFLVEADDHFELSVVDWFKNNGFPSLADGLMEYIDSGYAETPRLKFIELMRADIIKNQKEAEDPHHPIFSQAISKISRLAQHWQTIPKNFS